MFDPIIMARLTRLEEGGGYSEPGKVLFSSKMESGIFPNVTTAPKIGKIGLEVGKTYTVTLDSGTYSGVCKAFGEGEGGSYLGNAGLAGGEDTGESYCVVDLYDDGWIAYVFDGNNGSNCTVSDSKTIIPFNKDYLPGVTIDLADYGVDVIGMFLLGGGTNTLTDADKLWELVNANGEAPIAFHFESSDAKMAIDTAATKTIGASGKISGLTATIPVHADDKYFVAYLWVSLTSIKLAVTAVS